VSYIVRGDFNRLVPLLELSFVVMALAFSLICLIGIVVSPYLFENGGLLQRLTCGSTFFWCCVPQLMSCSALRTLHYISPPVLMSDGYIVWIQAMQVAATDGKAKLSWHTLRHYAHGAFSIFFFIFSRMCAFVLGFDAFLVKFRLASSAVDSGKMDFYSRLAAAAFVWQVMTIVQLHWFMEKRLFIFMFAGKDGSMDIDEEALVEVWKCLMLKKVYESFNFIDATCVMLGFDTYDLQFLALDDDEDVIRSSFERQRLRIGHKSFPSPTGIPELRGSKGSKRPPGLR